MVYVVTPRPGNHEGLYALSILGIIPQLYQRMNFYLADHVLGYPTREDEHPERCLSDWLSSIPLMTVGLPEFGETSVARLNGSKTWEW